MPREALHNSNQYIKDAVTDRSSKTKNQLIRDLSDSLECPICHEYMFVPMITPCGHTYCYGCLKNWFNSNRASDLSCPHCRTSISTTPALNTFVQQVFTLLCEQVKPSAKEHEEYIAMSQLHNRERQIYEDDLKEGSLFDSVFTESALALADESDDGIARCSNCHWELDLDEIEETSVCPHCSSRIRNAPNHSGNSHPIRLNRGFNSEEYSADEFEEQEREFRGTGTTDGHTIDAEAEDDDDEYSSDEEHVIPSSRHRREQTKYDDSEIDEDLQSFIAESEDEESISNISDEDEKAFRQSAEATMNDSNEYDSDFYEMHEGDGYVSGDSLKDDESDEKNSSPSLNRNKRQKRFQVVIDDSD